MKDLLLPTIVILLLLSSCQSQPKVQELQSVIAKDGNIYLKYESGDLKQVTDLGIDSIPVLSPDKIVVAFLRFSKGPIIEAGTGESAYNELWLYSIADAKSFLGVKCGQSDKMETVLANLRNLTFSPDSKYLYFTSTAWATSDAIHRYDLTTKTEQFISSGNSLQLVDTGQYAGHLIASKHKYYDSEEGGSYDHYWLLTPDGKEVMDIGDSVNVITPF